MMRVKGEQQNVAAVAWVVTPHNAEVHKRQLLEEIVALLKEENVCILKSCAATKCCDSQFVRVVKTHHRRGVLRPWKTPHIL